MFVFAAKSIVSPSQSGSANRRRRGFRRTEWQGRLGHAVCLFWQFGGYQTFNPLKCLTYLFLAAFDVLYLCWSPRTVIINYGSYFNVDSLNSLVLVITPPYLNHCRYYFAVFAYVFLANFRCPVYKTKLVMLGTFSGKTTVSHRDFLWINMDMDMECRIL